MCKFVIFGSSQKLKKVQNVSFLFTIHEETIERTSDCFKYVGVTVNSTIPWSDHQYSYNYEDEDKPTDWSYH